MVLGRLGNNQLDGRAHAASGARFSAYIHGVVVLEDRPRLSAADVQQPNYPHLQIFIRIEKVRDPERRATLTTSCPACG